MKLKRRRLIILIAVFVLLIGIAVLCYTQQGNLQALLLSMRYSEEELATLQEQSLADLLEEYGLDPLPQMSEETAASSDEPGRETEALTPNTEDAPPHSATTGNRIVRAPVDPGTMDSHQKSHRRTLPTAQP